MEKKSFFVERAVSEMKDLRVINIFTQEGLVEKINSLNLANEAAIIRTPLIPREFRRKQKGEIEPPLWKNASRKNYKHGDYLSFPQQRSLEETLASKKIPLDLRTEALMKLHEEYLKGGLAEKDIEYIGVSWRPVFGRVRQKFLIPFREICEGARLFSFAENFYKYKQQGMEKKGIKVNMYADAQRVSTEGAQCVVEIPSRTKEFPYRLALAHVPVLQNNPDIQRNYNLAIAFSMRPALIRTELSDEFESGRTPFSDYTIGYKYKNSREGSDVLHFSHLEVAAYLGILKQELTQHHNMTPLTFNPFPLPSQQQATFYVKLLNNVLMYDPTLERKNEKNKIRKLHVDEISMLLGRGIIIFGHYEFAFWESHRDKIYRDYDWSVPGIDYNKKA